MKKRIEKLLDNDGSDLASNAVLFDGLELWRHGAKGFIGEMVRRITNGERSFVCYLNAHTYNLLCKDDDYRTILSHADILYPDGISVVWGAYLVCGERTFRMTGVDFFDDFLRVSAQRGIKLYFLGSAPGVVDAAVERMKAKYADLMIVGSHHGYFEGEAQEAGVLADIQSSGAEALIVGMGSPIQEKFAWRSRDKFGSAVVWSVGALFDYYGGVEKAAPRWLAGLGFEWFYRLCRDPKRKWRRYLIGNVLFVWRVAGLTIRRLWNGSERREVNDSCDGKNIGS